MSEGRRCSREDWLRTGLQVLVEQGHGALKISTLAGMLGVTKGSFYWHFDNVSAFHDALIQHWHKRYISVAPRDAKNQETDAHPLLVLGAVLQDRDMPAIDAAMRRWSLVSDKAREAVAASERFRWQRAVEMLVSQGIDQKTAEARAQLLVWVWAGSAEESNMRWRLKVMGELFGLITADAAGSQRR